LARPRQTKEPPLPRSKSKGPVKPPSRFRLRDLWGVLSLALALLILLSLVSYTPRDPGWFSFSANAGLPHNWVGILGSYSADILLHLWGIGAYLLPILLTFGAMGLWRSDRRIWPWTLWGLGLLGVFSGLLGQMPGFVLTFTRGDGLTSTSMTGGGFMGSWLASLSGPALGRVGSVIVWLFLLIFLGLLAGLKPGV